MKSPAASRSACSPLVLLLAAGVAVGLPAEVAAQADELFADGAAYRPPAGQSYRTGASRPESSPDAWRGLAVGSGALALAGLGLATLGSLEFILLGSPFDLESHKLLRTCCIEQAFLAPAFLVMAGSGWLLGYSADRARQSDWDPFDTDPPIQGSRKGLIIGGVLLGTSTVLYVVSAILNAAMFSEVVRDPHGYYSLTPTGERLPSAVLGTMIPAMLLAFPGGVTTGLYLNRYLEERKRPGCSTSAAPGVGSVMLAPMLSREVYGLQASGRF